MFSLLKFKEVARAVPESTSAHRVIPETTTLEQLRAELLELMAQENTNHHRMGEIYNHIVDKKLAEKAGYKDAREYFSQHLADLSQSVADACTGRWPRSSASRWPAASASRACTCCSATRRRPTWR